MKNRMKPDKPKKPKIMIRTDCGHGPAVCPEARGSKGEPTTKNAIAAFLHCKQCLQELPVGESPRTYAQLEVGFTAIGMQVYCKRHEINVIHIDFEGHKHPANLAP